MTDKLMRCATHILNSASNLLHNADDAILTPPQLKSICALHDVAERLMQECEQLRADPSPDAILRVEHRLRNTLTSLRGYSKFLASERMGTLSREQHLDLLRIEDGITDFIIALNKAMVKATAEASAVA